MDKSVDDKWIERLTIIIKLLEGLPSGKAQIEWADRTVNLIKVRINDQEVLIRNE